MCMLHFANAIRSWVHVLAHLLARGLACHSCMPKTHSVRMGPWDVINMMIVMIVS